MKIAVVGGSGFMGTKLIDLLMQGPDNEIRNFDKANNVKHAAITCIGNVLDSLVLTNELAGADLVILLVAERRDDVTPVSLYYEVNVTGMENTLPSMEMNGVKRIVLSKAMARGFVPPYTMEEGLKRMLDTGFCH